MRYDQKDYWQRRRPCQDATPWQSKQQGRVAFLITTRKGTGRWLYGGGLLTAAYHLKRCRSPNHGQAAQADISHTVEYSSPRVSRMGRKLVTLRQGLLQQAA